MIASLGGITAVTVVSVALVAGDSARPGPIKPHRIDSGSGPFTDAKGVMAFWTVRHMQEATDADTELDGPAGTPPTGNSTFGSKTVQGNTPRASTTGTREGGMDEPSDTGSPTATSVPIPTGTTASTTSEPPAPTTTEPPAPTSTPTPTKPGAQKVVHPAAPSITPPSGSPRVTTAGKLFYVNDRGEKKTCSGSSINTEHKNIVITAAHCVHAFKGTKYFTDFIFVPGYDHGKTPFGKWPAIGVLTFDRWVNDHDYRYDQGFLRVDAVEGHQLGEVVGGNGLIVNATPSGVGKVIGWPFNGKYDGEGRATCEGKLATSTDISHRDMAIPCGMGNGVSGGPWLSSDSRKADSDLGYVVAVASGGAIDEKSHRRLLISAPLSQDVADVMKEHG